MIRTPDSASRTGSSPTRSRDPRPHAAAARALRILAIAAGVLLAPGAAFAIDRYVATTGNDAANDCTVPGTPCLTLQHAINQALANDVVNVAAGTYSVAGLVTVNKTLTLRGAQAGVDARTRAAAESVLANSQGMSVSSSNVVIDGFTIRDSSVAAFTGYGVWLNPGVNGTQVLNNIFTNNIVGLALANAGATQAVVRQNLFESNNLPGGASGTGIYADAFATGAVINVLIDANEFVGNVNAGIGFSTDASSVSSNIVITNNTFDSNGRGIYAFGAASILIQFNTLTNTTVPADAGQSSAISAFGEVTGMTILDNVLQDGAANGIRVADFLGAGDTNTGIQAHRNNITGFATAGLINADTVAVDATCNWWGAANGPTAAGNPGGSGDVVTGLAIFAPWLVAPAPGGACQVPEVKPVPALGPLALLLLVASLGALGGAGFRRRARR